MYSDTGHYSDELLFALVKKEDDQAAFAALYNRHWEHLLNAAFKRLQAIEAAEEVVQEVFVQLYANRKQIVLTSSLAGYLRTAVKFKVFNHYRAQQLCHKYAATCLHEPPAAQETPHDRLSYKELHEKIQMVAEMMPQKCREVFFLSRYEYLPQQVIADRLGITLSTVKKHLTKALRILRTELYGYRQNLLIIAILLPCCLAG